MMISLSHASSQNAGGFETRAKRWFTDIIYGFLSPKNIIAILLLAIVIECFTGTFERGSDLEDHFEAGGFSCDERGVGLFGGAEADDFVARFRMKRRFLSRARLVVFYGFRALKIGLQRGVGLFQMGALIAESHDHSPIGRLDCPITQFVPCDFCFSSPSAC
jgi:hypothetical protein